jgi:hypothetical protein
MMNLKKWSFYTILIVLFSFFSSSVVVAMEEGDFLSDIKIKEKLILGYLDEIIRVVKGDEAVDGSFKYSDFGKESRTVRTEWKGMVSSVAMVRSRITGEKTFEVQVWERINKLQTLVERLQLSGGAGAETSKVSIETWKSLVSKMQDYKDAVDYSWWSWTCGWGRSFVRDTWATTAFLFKYGRKVAITLVILGLACMAIKGCLSMSTFLLPAQLLLNFVKALYEIVIAAAGPGGVVISLLEWINNNKWAFTILTYLGIGIVFL